jgi:hypothetical protein
MTSDGPFVSALLALLACALCAPAGVVRAAPEEGAAGLSVPESGVRRPRRPRATPEAEPEPAAAPRGAGFQLGWSRYRLTDGAGGGSVDAFEFALNLAKSTPLRIGFRGQFGARRYALGPDDALLRAAFVAGYQYLPERVRVVPYAVFVSTIGLQLGKRFHTPQRNALGGFGLELGTELSPVPNLSLVVSVGYQRLAMAGLAYDVFIFGLAVGL